MADAKSKINPNRDIKTRDYALLAVILGATKGGVQKDRRKEASRKQCRGKYRGDD